MKRVALALVVLGLFAVRCGGGGSPAPPDRGGHVDVAFPDGGGGQDVVTPPADQVEPTDEGTPPRPDARPDVPEGNDVPPPRDAPEEEVGPDVPETPPCTPGTVDADCDDGDGCTIPECINERCVYTNKQCRPEGADPCDVWTCNSATGACEHYPNANPDCEAFCWKQPNPDAYCDDGNNCSGDACDQWEGCQYEALTQACNDGNACTEGERCANMRCGGGTLRDCDDADDCTLDYCDPSSAEGCRHLPIDPCGPVVCELPGNPCPDIPDPCRELVCNGGECEMTFPTEVCDDNDPCTEGERCQDGGCTGGFDVNCSDGDPCTVDSCVSDLGGCINNRQEPCLHPCATVEDCRNLPGAESQCVQWTCNHDGFCLKVNIVASCNDGDPCTRGDYCVEGACRNLGPTDCAGQCDPGEIPSCDRAQGGCLCTPLPICGGDDCGPGTGIDCCQDGTDCNDGDPCTIDACLTYEDPSICVCEPQPFCSCNPNAADGGAGACDDGDPCTIDSCNPNENPLIEHRGLCEHVFSLEACCPEPCTAHGQCDDALKCTINRCEALSETSSCCTYPLIPWPCGKPCTLDAECNDNDPCTAAVDFLTDKCGADGTCDPSFLNMEDLCPCEVDSQETDCAYLLDDVLARNLDCVEVQCVQHTCQLVNLNVICDDGDDCTIGDSCVDGECATGETRDCNDDDNCTIDSCEQGSGCVHVLDSGNPVCIGCTSAADCEEDTNPCTEAICVIPEGRPQGRCETVDTNAGQDTAMCIPAPCSDTFQCDDGNPCTNDQCIQLDETGQPLAEAARYCFYTEVAACTVPEILQCAAHEDCEITDCQPTLAGAFCQIADEVPLCPEILCDAEIGCRFLPHAETCETLFATGCAPIRQIDDCWDQTPCTADICGADLQCENTEIPLAEDNLFNRCIVCAGPDGAACPTEITGLPFPVDCIEITCEIPDGPVSRYEEEHPYGICVARIDQASFPNACEDYDLCTIDGCSAGGGCSHAARNASCELCLIDGDCDDGDPCTEDACDAEACPEGESCAPGFACEHTPVAGCTACAGHQDCLTDDFCDGMLCLQGRCQQVQFAPDISFGPVCLAAGCMTDVDCDDGDPASLDRCLTGDGACLWQPDPAAPGFTCQNVNQCFERTACERVVGCVAGACVFEPIPGCTAPQACTDRSDCADDNPCSLDLCANGECGHRTAGFGCCESTTDCVGDPDLDRALEGKCAALSCGPSRICGVALLGDEIRCGNGCESDADCARTCDAEFCRSFCLSETECYDWPCSQGYCATNRRCVWFDGDCTGCTEDRECEDGDPCTTDTCDAGGACVHTPDAGCTPVACGADNPCASDDPCQLGICLSTGCVWLPNPACD